MIISRIEFPCHYFDKNGKQLFGKTIFKLGLGPCGKEATTLQYEISDFRLTIRQFCGDEYKEFIYRLADICGRIEVTYA